MKTHHRRRFPITGLLLSSSGLILLLAFVIRAQNQTSRAATSASPPAKSNASLPLSYPSTSLWMRINGPASNGTIRGVVYGTAPDSPYFLLSKPSISDTGAWSVEQLLIGNSNYTTPFSFPLSNHPNSLFLSVRPWSSNDEISSGFQIAITNPLNGSVFSIGPTNLNLAASISDSNPVLGVAFYNRTNVLGWASNTPFSLPWAAPTGIHILSARAFDIAGHSRTSDPITNTVGATGITQKSVSKPSDSAGTGHFKSLSSCTNAPSGLIGWWRAEGDASDTLHLHDGALQGGATANTSGEVGNAFHFDGSNSCVVVQDSLALRPTNFTIEAWVRFSNLDTPNSGGAVPVGKQYIVFRQNSQENSFEGFSLVKARVGSETRDRFKFVTTAPGGSAQEVTSDSFVTTNVWYHVAAVRGSNYIQIYTNGHFSAQTTVTDPVDYGYWPLNFGSSGQNYWDRKLAGDLDEVAIYNRALSSNEIQAIYDAGSYGKCLPATTVQLLCPADGARFYSPSNIFLTVSPYSPGSVTNVQFFTNGVKLGESTLITNALSTLTWTNPPLGTFAITAITKDNLGLSATSSVANVTITAIASFFAGINLNGINMVGTNNMVIDGNVWTSYVAALTNGLVVSNNVHGDSVTNSISADASVNAMLQTFLRADRFPPPVQQTNQPVLTLRTTNCDSFFLVGLSNVPTAYAVTNAVTYRGWCLGSSNNPSLVQSFEYTYGPYAVTNSRLQSVNFNQLNYLINHKSATNGSEIQNAIWSLIGRGQNFTNANVVAMTNDAVLHGSSFIPGTNQLALVVLDTGTDQPVCIEMSGVDASQKSRTFSITQSGLTNGYYYVGLWLAQVQTNCLSSLDIRVQDATAAIGIGSDLQYGQWAKYGAYGGNVTNGSLKIEVISPVRGDPMLMGLAIYKAVTNPPAFQLNLTNQTACCGSAVTFCATNVSGDLPLVYQWSKNGSLLSGQTSSCLALSNITNSDAGTYTLVVTNAAGAATNSGTLIVWTNVSILTSPTDTNSSPGGTASFTINAAGSGLHYQWSHATTNLLNRTNATLTLSNIAASAAGQYCVTVSDPCNSITNCATLTVTCLSATSNLVAWWQGESNPYDAVGGLNGSEVGSVTYGSGKVGQAFNLGGIGSYVDVGNPAGLQLQELTIEAWIQRADASVATANGGSGGFIFGYGSHGYTLALYNNGRLTFSKVGVNEVTTGPLIADTSFHHVAVTKSGGTVTFYVDSVAYVASTYNPGFEFSTDAAIGAGAAFNMVFWGVIDEVAVYNRALSALEIAAIYDASAIGRCGISPAFLLQPVSQTNTVGNDIVLHSLASGTSPLGYHWYFNSNSLAGATSPSLGLYNVQLTNAGTYSVQVTSSIASITSTNAHVTVVTPSCLPVPTGLVSWWQGEANGIDAVSTNNLTLASVAFASGKVGQAFSLDGLASYGLAPASSSLDVGPGAGLTLECWINPSDIVNAYPLLEWNDGWGGYGVHLWINAGGMGVISANMVEANSTEHPIYSDSNPVISGRFQHVALTYDQTSGVAKIYWNGIQAASQTVGSFTPLTSSDFYVGLRPFGSEDGAPYGIFYSGLIDEPGVYNRALSADEIRSLYLASIAGKCSSPAVSVVINSPTNGQFFASSPTNILISATASTPTGSVSWVEFRAGTNRLGVVATGGTNYQLNWNPVYWGAYDLTALAQDSRGSNAISPHVNINVGRPPTVSITSPTNGTAFGPSPTNITTTATATAYGGASITNVVFYNGPNILGSDPSSPYALSWNAVTNGSYTLRAKAADDRGVIGISRSVHISVNPTNQPPIADSGSNQTIRLPAPALLIGSAYDDGLPVGSHLVSHWSRLSGPGTITFANSNQLLTTATFSMPGTNLLQLSVSDSQFTVTTNVAVVALPTNAAPSVNAGSDQTVTLAAHYSFTNGIVNSTTTQNTRTAQGKEFWIGFPHSSRGGPTLMLYFASETDTLVSVMVPGIGFYTNCQVSAGVVNSLQLPSAAESTDNEQTIQGKGIHIRAENRISVYAISSAAASTDGYLALPVTALGSNYVAIGWKDTGGSPTSLMIVGVSKRTTVWIMPSANCTGHPLGTRYSVSLDEGQTYELYGTGDLSGTTIDSDKPIALFGGSPIATIPEGAAAANFLVEQMPPTNAWGSDFITAPLAHRNGGDTFKIVACAYPTTIKSNGVAVATLNQGQAFTNDMAAPARITADQPILLAQYGRGNSVSSTNGFAGDPFMMLIPPLEQHSTRYAICAPDLETYTWFHFANVVITNAGTNTLWLDGTNVSSSLFSAVADSGFSYAQIPLDPGYHQLSSSLPFGLNVYGLASGEDAYGFPGGASVAKINERPSLTLSPRLSTNEVGSTFCLSVAVTNQYNQPIAGVRVDFHVLGSNSVVGFAFTEDSGVARFCYTGTNLGADTIQAFLGTNAVAATNTWELPSFTLHGFVSDDGLQIGVTNIAWTQVGGPPGAVFANAATSNTIVHVSDEGYYVFRLTADDTELTNYDEVAISVVRNRAPSVDAGTDQITKNFSATLSGAVSDDGLPNGVVTSTWTKASGPGTITFSQGTTTNTAPSTTASFSAPGIYVIRLTADDSQAAVFSEVTITAQVDAQVASCAQIVNGNLASTNTHSVEFTNRYANYYRFSGQSNQPLVVTMTSTSFDTYLFIRDDTFQIFAEDDDTFYSTNSQIVFYPPHDGDYLIEATSCFPLDTGAYSMRFDCAPLNAVTIISPTNGAIFPVAPTDITINMAFSYPAVSWVQLFTNGVLLDNIFSPPYDTYTWHNAAAGFYSITALVSGTPSSPVNIAVAMPILTLTPAVAVPRLLNTPTTILATLRNSDGSLLAATNFSFAVTGANATNYSIITNASAVAFTYQGANSGHDVITALAVANGITNVATGIERNWAVPVSCGTIAVGQLSRTDQVSARSTYADYFSFTGNSNDVVSLNMSSTTIDAYQTLWNSNGVVLAENDDYDGTDSHITFTLPADGTYFVEASACYPAKTGPYGFELECNSAATTGSPNLIVLENTQVLPNYSTVDFGATTSGVPVYATLTISNSGNATLHLHHTAQVSGNFTLTSPPTNLIPASTSAPFTVRFNATANGVAVGAVTFFHSAGNDENPFTLGLIATANLPGTPPTVSLTMPTNNSRFQSGSTIQMIATSSAATGSISKVEFFSGSTSESSLLGKSTGSPCTNYWVQPPVGSGFIFATATDDAGRIGHSSPVNVTVYQNRAPVGNDDYPTVLANSKNNVFHVLDNDSDPDGDTLTIIARKLPAYGTATIIDNGKAISYTPKSGQYGGDGFYYQISDGHGGTGGGAVVVDIFASDIPSPAITNPPSGYTTNAGAIIPITAYVTPSDYVTKVDFYLGQTLIGTVTNGSNGVYTYLWTALYKNCDCLVTATATDQFGQMGTSPGIRINVSTPTNGVLPFAGFDTYIGSDVARPFTNMVTVRDGLFDLYGRAYHSLNSNLTWQLELYSTDGNLIRDLTPASHSSNVGSTSTSNLLTHCDLTTIQNGIYDLRLTVTAGYATTNATVRFALDSNLKIGQFGFNQQDLVIPVNGIPLTVVRTYNSLNPNRGDFGYSWTWALNSMDIALDERREDVPDFTDPDDTLFSERSGGQRDVTLTLPDGHRTTFTFYFDGPYGCTAGADGQFCYFAKWQAAPGVTATLEAKDESSLVAIPGFPPYWQAGGPQVPMDVFDFSGWTLTTLDGTKYIIEREDLGEHDVTNEVPYSVHAYGKPNLLRIEQRTGDKILIGSDSIRQVNTNGVETRRVTFERNDDGLITAIFDPISQLATNNPSVKYEYDSDDNLMNVLTLTDRNAGTYVTTTFSYTNSHFTHYITSITDPRGIPIARNEYDDDGRLTAVIDADGNRTEFRHNTTNRVEVVIDRLGRTNSHVYDLRGNVISSTNALGAYTLMSYDDKNNMTSTTDALGHTTSCAYDGKNNQTNVVNALNRTNSSMFDSYGNLTRQTDPLGNSTTNIYDSSGNLTSTIQKDSNGTTLGQNFSIYDSGRLVATEDANGNTNASFTYDASSNLATSTDARGATHTFGYDSNGSQTSSSWTVGSSNITTSTEYDSQGRVIRSIDAFGKTNQTFYNSLGRVDYTIDRLGNTNSFFYDTRGNTVQIIGSDGLATKTVYDGDGKAIYVSDRTGITGARTDYDLASRVTNMVRLTNISITISPVSDGIWTSSLASAGTPYSTNKTEYFANGWVKSRTGPDGQKTSYTYYDDGQTATVTDALTNVTTYAYDDAGRQKQVTDALNHTAQFVFDGVGRNVKTILADNSSITNIFNLLGQQIAKLDQASVMISNVFDISGQLTSVVMPRVPDPENSGHDAQPTWSYGFDQYGRQISMTDAKGRSTTNVFDAYGRQISVVLPRGETNYVTYDSFGRVSNRFDFKGQKQLTRYDRLGRVATNFWFAYGASSPSNSTEYYYNTLGQLTNITERSGDDASSTYVASIGSPGTGNRVPRYVAALNRFRATPPEVLGDASAFALTAFTLGLIALTGLAKRRVTAECLNRGFRGLHGWERLLPLIIRRICAGQISSSFAPLPSVESGNIRVNPRNSWLNFFVRPVTYALIVCLIGNEWPFDRLWTAHAECVYPYNDSTETKRTTEFHYDFDGHLTQVNCPEGVINYEYDVATGRHTRTCTTNSEVAYGYDALGRLKTVTALKRNSVTLTNSEITTCTYTAVGNRSTVTLPNGIVTRYLYDELNRLTNLTHQVGTTNLATYSYTLHSTGRRTGATEIIRQENGTYLTNTLAWQYDQMYRLTNEVSASSSAPGNFTNNYAYDKVGNRWSKTHWQADVTVTTNQFNANDQLLKEVTWNGSTMTESNAYAYDDNGSLTTKAHTIGGSTTTVTYGYDLKNKLSTFSDGTSTRTYLYNDQGIRVRTSTSGSATYYLIDANNHTGYQQILEEFSTPNSQPSTSYVLGDDVLSQCAGSPTDSRWMLYDGHGSTRQLVSGNLTASKNWNYDAYGNSLESLSNPLETSLLYCGAQYDSALAMYNLRARFYSAGTGRFNAMDSFTGNNDEPQGLHKYLYCHGDPVDGQDLSGNFESLIGVLAVVMIALMITPQFANAPAPGDRSARNHDAEDLALNLIAAAVVGAAIIAPFVRYAARPVFRFTTSTVGKLLRPRTAGVTAEEGAGAVGSEAAMPALQNWIARTFESSLYISRKLTAPIRVWRAQVKAGRQGQGIFYLTKPPTSMVDAEVQSNANQFLPPGTVRMVLSEYEIKAGTLVYEGRIAGGSGTQVVCLDDAAATIVSERALFFQESPIPGWFSDAPPPGSLLQ